MRVIPTFEYSLKVESFAALNKTFSACAQSYHLVKIVNDGSDVFDVDEMKGLCMVKIESY